MVVNLILLVVAVGLSLLAGYLLQKKQRNLAKDDKPTTLATRGTFIPYVLGIRRIGPVFCWAGDRRSAKEKAQGGKGGIGSSPKVDVYYERGMHVLCAGPAFCLRRIYQHGKIIFEGPITRKSHPSGSRVDLGSEGAFDIYWGEPNQPINNDLGVSTRIGIASRWPHICYVYWDEKRLGQQPTWPLLDYVIEVDLPDSEALLPSSQKYYEPTFTLDGPTYPIFQGINGAEFNGSNHSSAGQFIILGDHSQEFRPKGRIEVTGNSANGTHDVLGTQVIVVEVMPPPFPIYSVRTRVFIDGGLSGANSSGNMQGYTRGSDDGYNPAHCIAQALFGSFPLGYAFDQAEWNVQGGGFSLDALGLLFETERPGMLPLIGSLIGLEGEELQAVIGAALQDFGVMVPINPVTGLIDFRPIREPASIKTISDDLILDPAPQVESYLGERPVDRIVFVFSDRDFNYRDMTIAVDEDGEASRGEYQRARRVQITATTHYPTASECAERRSQEELAGGVAIKVNAARDTRSLLPGDVLQFEELPDVYRLMDVSIDPLTGVVELGCIPDFYGVAKSQFVNNTGGGQVALKPATQDLAVAIVEIPAYLNATGQIQVLPARIRAHNQTTGTDIWLSDDNTSYTLIERRSDTQAGGQLDAEFSLTNSNYLAQGPTITVLGDEDDIIALDSLTPLSDSNWRQGRLIAIIGDEILFVKNLVQIGPNQWRLDDVLRARYDTKAATHPAGTAVFLADAQAVLPITDLLMQPSVGLFLKSAPISSAGAVPVANVAPVYRVLEGKGVAPIRPWALRVTAPFTNVRAYKTGNNISFDWGYRSTATPKTGAGQQPAGTPVAASAIQGFFELEFQSGVTIRTVQIPSGTTYTLTNAQLVAWFSGEPATLTVRLRNLNGALRSVPEEIAVVKIT